MSKPEREVMDAVLLSSLVDYLPKDLGTAVMDTTISDG